MNTTEFAKLAEMLSSMEPDTPPKKVLSGNPQLFYKELADTDKLNAGVWRSTVGSWEIESWSVNEVMLIQSGHVRLTDSDGNATDLTAGDAMYIAKGWSGRWETLEDVEKFYVIVY